jgi:hypothetical protein
MPLTSADVLIFLSILIGIMFVVVLYHVLFIVVDIRRVMRRVDSITEQVEAVVLKPLAIADQAIASIMELFENGGKKKHGKHLFHRKDVD